MLTEFIFTVGLPGCGKSTYLKEHYKNAFDFKKCYESHLGISEYCATHIMPDDYVIIAADDIKEFLDGYTDEHPEGVHEDSVQLARNYVFQLISSDIFTGKVIMDGGGLNNNYTQSIVERVREANPATKITCIFFDTPIDVCIDRVNSRDRKIPEYVFFEKNLKIQNCITRYQEEVDEYIRVDYYTNKHIFLDMDGTIVSYRKGKLDQEGNVDMVNSQMFLTGTPVKHIIDFVKEHFDMRNVYIISAVANDIVLSEKLRWMEKYFPELPKENFHWCGNKEWKHVFLKHFAISQKWNMNDVTIIDDMHSILHKCTEYGMNAVHPSNINAIIDKYQTLG